MLGDGTAATVRSAASSSFASSTALVISSTNRGMPSVRSMMSCRTFAGSSLLPMTRSTAREVLVSYLQYDRRVRDLLDQSNAHPQKSSTMDFGATRLRFVKQEL